MEFFQVPDCSPSERRVDRVRRLTDEDCLWVRTASVSRLKDAPVRLLRSVEPARYADAPLVKQFRGVRDPRRLCEGVAMAIANRRATELGNGQ